MNFEGKVKKSSIKNFILEDRDDKNAKTILFGKVDDDDYVLDVLNPLSPLVGIGIVMTVFDTRMGSDWLLEIKSQNILNFFAWSF